MSVPACSNEDERARTIQILRFLAASRKEYFRADRDLPYSEWSTNDQVIHAQFTTADLLADILEGKDDAQGWLPSWRWDEYTELVNGAK